LDPFPVSPGGVSSWPIPPGQCPRRGVGTPGVGISISLGWIGPPGRLYAPPCDPGPRLDGLLATAGGLAVAAEPAGGWLGAHRPPPDAARTSIMMDARTDSGSPDQAASSSALSESAGNVPGRARVAPAVARGVRRLLPSLRVGARCGAGCAGPAGGETTGKQGVSALLCASVRVSAAAAGAAVAPRDRGYRLREGDPVPVPLPVFPATAAVR
jgi:hypothetical protein